ncbi:YciI family protein [Actinoplanes sp. TFC3]|uniref:YciI family protein n=1 Tax=Actinoplanes sp. TFC3 TaxID=1710355 RepID=UPI000836CAF2|nr:YciI family protein [Actinoplanes sp. TFC3]
MYVMISTYLAPLEEVDDAREDHLAFLAGLEERGLVVSAGRQQPAVGGVVILGVDSEDEAVKLMTQDPYVQRNLAEYRAIGWQPSRGVLAGWKNPS